MLYLYLENYLKRFNPALIVVVNGQGEWVIPCARLSRKVMAKELSGSAWLFDLVILFEFIVRFDSRVLPCWYLPYLLSYIAFS